MKLLTLSVAGTMAIALSACGATTGGVAQSMAQKTAASVVSSQLDKPQASSPEMGLTAINPDAGCATLEAQISETDAIIMASNETISGGGANQAAGSLAATAARTGAARSGATRALSKVPFGNMFAKATIDSLENSGKEKVEKAQSDLDAATLRKAELMGLYAGKNCAS